MAQYDGDTYKKDSYKLYEAVAQVASDSHVPNIAYCTVAVVAALGKLNLVRWDVKSTRCKEMGNKANRFDFAFKTAIKDSKVDIKKAEFQCYNENFQPSSGYKNLLKQQNIDLIPLKFDDLVKTAELINIMVKERTKGAIEQAVTPRNIEESFLITVAGVCMKTAWDFPLQDSSLQKFHTTEREYKKNMMKGTGLFRTKKIKIAGCAVTALGLPLNRDALGFYILMPDVANQLQVLDKNLHEINLEEILKETVQMMDVIMPAFITGTDLVCPLTTTHIDPGKTFSPPPDPKYKPKVTTGASITVAASGIFCESVSAAGNITIDPMIRGGAVQAKKEESLHPCIIIDRPFVFILAVNRVPLEQGSNVIPFFIGRYEDPTKEIVPASLVVPLDDSLLE
ncbi:uncharacterized protein [Lepisosteus oculatus]|uniref:uncharacterized protein n=1 Tax=Lepisosteus oculatus TaxID=7918 RepID=UPI0035F51795